MVCLAVIQQQVFYTVQVLTSASISLYIPHFIMILLTAVLPHLFAKTSCLPHLTLHSLKIVAIITTRVIFSTTEVLGSWIVIHGFVMAWGVSKICCCTESAAACYLKGETALVPTATSLCAAVRQNSDAGGGLCARSACTGITVKCSEACY
jgi:hypothetical protein